MSRADLEGDGSDEEDRNARKRNRFMVTSSGFVVRADEGRLVPGAAGKVLASGSATDGALSVLLSHAPPGDQAPLHVHHHESESFFILTGTYRIHCGDETFEAAAHDFVHLPQGVPHAWQVISETAGQKLILAVPGGIEDFFDDLIAGASPDDIAHRHGVQFLG